MIELLDFDSFENRHAAAKLADTLHNMSIINDAQFDLLLINIYERYGERHFYEDFRDDDLI